MYTLMLLCRPSCYYTCKWKQVPTEVRIGDVVFRYFEMLIPPSNTKAGEPMDFAACEAKVCVRVVVCVHARANVCVSVCINTNVYSCIYNTQIHVIHKSAYSYDTYISTCITHVRMVPDGGFNHGNARRPHMAHKSVHMTHKSVHMTHKSAHVSCTILTCKDGARGRLQS